ncbi:unnamed protein product [Menidia menidia]|uniref:(Atlantic silverside) hypothetical protein n=1 Tax=Menidia menidia TaxID=238744 RepID=A0A8S4AVS3_9TELE|nr:unnamed protein product [Menidia menidia]
MSKKYGSNCLIQTRDEASGEVVCTGFAVPPLHLAASYRKTGSMQRLLSAGADAEMRDRLGRTPLHLVTSGWPNLPDPRPKQGSKFWRALTGAERQAEACLRLLCEHGANVNAQVEGKSPQTALHISVQHKALSAVQILVSYGADVDAVDSSGMTPLHMAAGMLQRDIIASLVRQGADINVAVQNSGNTPLHLAAVAIATKMSKTTDDDIGCVSDLLELGAKPDVANAAGMTPLHAACAMGSRQLADVLLRHGADVNKPSEAGETCLFLFLNHRPDLKSPSLLSRLLSLTSPLTISNRSGGLPSALTEPRFFRQRERLLKLLQQPGRLQDICKREVYLKYVAGGEGELKKVLPDRLLDFVFRRWDVQHILF